MEIVHDTCLQLAIPYDGDWYNTDRLVATICCCLFSNWQLVNWLFRYRLYKIRCRGTEHRYYYCCYRGALGDSRLDTYLDMEDL